MIWQSHTHNSIHGRCMKAPAILGLCIMLLSLHSMSCHQNAAANLDSASCELSNNDSSLIIDEFRSKFEGGKYLCLISYSNECPVAKNYINTIKSLYSKFGNEVTFCLLDPGVGTKPISGMEKTGFSDPTLVICKRYNIQVYPQVVLVNCLERKILYAGKIDDRAVALGTVKIKAEHHYLKDALEQLISTGCVKVHSNQAVGCFVGDLALN